METVMYLVRTFLQSCFSTLSNIYDGKFCENRSRHLESKIRLYGNVPDSLLNRVCLIACLACYKRVHVPTCIACLRAHVPTCPACLRAHVPTCFAYLRASVLWILTCSWENVHSILVSNSYPDLFCFSIFTSFNSTPLMLLVKITLIWNRKSAEGELFRWVNAFVQGGSC